MSALIDLTGQQFSYLTAIRHIKNGKSRWLCRCVCGKETVVLSYRLRSGRVRSCGCKRMELIIAKNKARGFRGGRQNRPLYNTWLGMVQRCTNPESSCYQHYGGRGITVCDRWLNSFDAFSEDMGPRPKGKSIDRIDNNKGYSPDNCRWATRHEQMNNTRQNVWIEHNGVTMTASQWSRELGINVRTLCDRAKKGWPAELILYQGNIDRSALEVVKDA